MFNSFTVWAYQLDSKKNLFPTTASLDDGFSFSKTQPAHTHNTTTDYTPTVYTPPTAHNRLHTTDYTQRLHTTDYAQPTTHNRQRTTDYTQPTTHNRLHTTDYKQWCPKWLISLSLSLSLYIYIYIYIVFFFYFIHY